MSIKTPLNANGQIEDFIKILHTTTSAQEVNASVNTYLFNFLGIEESQKSEDEKLLISNNFIHLMCQVIDDLRIIDERLTRYNNEREQLESSKTNESEYRRRKLIYFADLNRKAQNDIVNFLNYGIKDYLQSTSFDTLQMQPTNKNDLYSRRRYMFSLVSDYYEADFDYSTVVKISHIPEENPLDIPEKEKKYILLRQKSPQQYYTNIRLLIEHNKILEYLKEHIAQNYHLNKRSEIFLDLASLYEQGHYQSFIALGILQLEGLFFDICSIKYDYKENAGTLVEKADKALKSRSKIRFMKYYPYFAFDVPVMRNEIAHIGLTNSQNIEQKADELLLDLNAVARMAIMESEEKFRFFIDIYSKLSQTGFNDIEAVNHELVCELLADNMIAPDSFWDVLKCPSNFKEEIAFYKQDNAQKGIVDLPTMVYTISEMVYQLPFWSEMVKSIDLEYNTDYFNQFLLFMAKNYIANLDDDCKKQCVEILKTLQ